MSQIENVGKFFPPKPDRFINIFHLLFWLLIFFNIQTFGHAINFCYDGSKEDHRLDSEVIKIVHAHSEVDCILQCMLQDKSCRSVNFRKTCAVNNGTENCQLLYDVASEIPELLHEDECFDHLVLLQPNRIRIVKKNSCQQLLKEDRSLANGVYKLRNNNSLEEYSVYCHMTEITGCGTGGWTLVMKIDGNKNEFNYSSPYWTNKETFAVEDGLGGLNEKQAKLASYWNTPFNKICLGMKVSGVTKWIVIDHQASSLFHVIAGENFKATTVGKNAWKSLIKDSHLQDNCNKEGFNIRTNNKLYHDIFLYYNNVRIGLVANNQNDCESCNSCIGFGIAVHQCDNVVRDTSCGNVLVDDCANPENNKETAAFGYILVQ